MRFKINSQLEYSIGAPSTLILNVHALRTPAQTILEESFAIEPFVSVEEFVSASGENRFVRLETGKRRQIKVSYRAVVDRTYLVLPAKKLQAVPIKQLDRTVIPFLFPSRYCQSDRLARLAWSKFGSIRSAHSRVVAIADWIYENVEYLRGSTNSETSAYDTVTQRAGVCRDFAHLGIALCRALSIPARYFTGYATRLEPPDFHACFEAYIGGRWLLFDATRLVPLNGLVRIGMGRDAADTAVATIFGSTQLTSMSVSCAPVGDFDPLTVKQLGGKGISLDAG